METVFFCGDKNMESDKLYVVNVLLLERLT